ncbi:AMP-binding protein [Chitinophaga sp.]|uniref:AMP-binding protein n=1 Tax=Chitinophaga sp. TaxID=1869181 RepID=UPI0031E2CE14
MSMKKTDANVSSFLIANSKAYPEKAAFVILSIEEEEPRTTTYGELETCVKQVANLLHQQQLKDKMVLMIYQDMRSFIIAFLACQYAGVIAVPVPFAKGRKQLSRINGILADTQANTILCTEDTLPLLTEELPQGVLLLPTDSKDLPGADFPPVTTNIAFLQYTSGSVGVPKGVIVSGRNLLHNEQLIKETFGTDEDTIVLSWLPFHHDMGLIGNVLQTIYTGCTCILMSPLHFMQRPLAWLENIAKYKVTHSGGPNFAYDLCVERITSEEAATLDLSSWKVAYNGAEPLHAATLQRFSDHFRVSGFSGHAYMPCYGMAEATLLVSAVKSAPAPVILHIDKEACEKGRIELTVAGEDAKAVVSSGKPAKGMYVKIVSLTEQRECGELEEGEICIAGESVTSGYWNRDNSTLFHAQYLRTGDLGFMYKGELYVHGRVKEMLIVRGKNIYPYDVEECVVACSAMIETNGVAVFAVGDDNQIVVVAEIKRAFINHYDAPAMIAAIDRTVAGELGVSPHDIVLTTPLGIPRTTSGKLQRVRCKQFYEQQLFKVVAAKSLLASATPAAGRNSSLLEQLLETPSYDHILLYIADMIADKTGERFSVLPDANTDLTSLGIDSLRAMEMINTINEELSVHLDATKIHQHNTLSELCMTIEALTWLKTGDATASGKEIMI